MTIKRLSIRYIFTAMPSYNDAFYELRSKLQPLYDEREAAAIAHEVLDHITGLDRTQRLLQKLTDLTTPQYEQYEDALKALSRGAPVQHVTHTAWFMNRGFFVNNNVLIPRPETEELVQWIVREIPDPKSGLPDATVNILDIGTGSGCIAVSLKLAVPEARITACDISREALIVARQNAKKLAADIAFVQLDFLEGHQQQTLPDFNIIVSNPPYIPSFEKEKLHANVRDYEPGIALFVPDDDALVFYSAIALFGKSHLQPGGRIYCELDAAHAEDCRDLFEDAGYKDVELKKDMFGNWRMLRACLN